MLRVRLRACKHFEVINRSERIFFQRMGCLHELKSFSRFVLVVGKLLSVEFVDLFNFNWDIKSNTWQQNYDKTQAHLKSWNVEAKQVWVFSVSYSHKCRVEFWNNFVNKKENKGNTWNCSEIPRRVKKSACFLILSLCKWVESILSEDLGKNAVSNS